MSYHFWVNQWCELWWLADLTYCKCSLIMIIDCCCAGIEKQKICTCLHVLSVTNGHLIRANALTQPHTWQGRMDTKDLAALDTNILTYGLNINSTVTGIGGLAVRVSVEAVEILRLLRVSRNPVWVRVHCDGLEQGTRLSWVESLLQKMPFFFCVLAVEFSQVLMIVDQSCLQPLHGVLDHLHLQEWRWNLWHGFTMM